MPLCCPAGRGCNAPQRGEPCVLELCRGASAEPEAALAVQRWEEWRAACRQPSGRAEKRFRRRAYERARENALVVLLMRAEAAQGQLRRAVQHPARPRRGAPLPAHPATRLRVLLRQYGEPR